MKGVISWVALCAITGIVGPAVAEPAAPVYRPTQIAGQGEWSEGSYKVTSERAEWAFPGGARVVAFPGTVIRVLKISQPLQLKPGQETTAFTIMLKAGRAHVNVPAGSRTAMVVMAPKKTSAIVSGGVSDVVVTESKVMVASHEGETTVAVAASPFKPLEPGMLRVVDDAAGEIRPLAGSPGELNGARVQLSFGKPVSLSGLSWDPAPGAASYRVELREKGAAKARTVETTGTTLPSDLTVGPGSYTLRVAAVDPSGLESAKVLEEPLRVISLALPPGGYVDAAGSVRLPTGTKLALSHVEGVELTYGAAGHFMKAPPSLELVRGEPRLVSFKTPGNFDFASLQILPRDARARIEVTPRVPSWPRDRINIRVRLEEANGAPVPTFIQAKPKVIVGLETTPVEFRDAGGGWLNAELPARSGAGPWVVRVEVADQYGIDLGRDFIEVAASPQGHKVGSGAGERVSRR
jgi:hypothetical protein